MPANASLVASFVLSRAVVSRVFRLGRPSVPYNGKSLEREQTCHRGRGNEISRTRARCALMNSSWIGIEVVRDHCVVEQWVASTCFSRDGLALSTKNLHVKLINRGEGYGRSIECLLLPTGEIVAGDYPRNRNSLMNNASRYIPLYFSPRTMLPRVSSGFAIKTNLDWPVLHLAF